MRSRQEQDVGKRRCQLSAKVGACASELQVPRLRFAALGMTPVVEELGMTRVGFIGGASELQVPRLRSG